MGDEASANVNTTPTPKTRREKNLEAELERETDPAKKRAMREELDDLKRGRIAADFVEGVLIRYTITSD